MWMMPTGRPSSTTNRAVMLDELIDLERGARQKLRRHRLGRARHDLAGPPRQQPVAHVPAQIAVGDDPGEPAVAVDHAETAERLLGHHHDGLGHEACRRA